MVAKIERKEKGRVTVKRYAMRDDGTVCYEGTSEASDALMERIVQNREHRRKNPSVEILTDEGLDSMISRIAERAARMPKRRPDAVHA